MELFLWVAGCDLYVDVGMGCPPLPFSSFVSPCSVPWTAQKAIGVHGFSGGCLAPCFRASLQAHFMLHPMLHVMFRVALFSCCRLVVHPTLSCICCIHRVIGCPLLRRVAPDAS